MTGKAFYIYLIVDPITQNMHNILFYWRLFLDLDMLTVSTYAARYSAYNLIEHLWSPLSNLLACKLERPKVFERE